MIERFEPDKTDTEACENWVDRYADSLFRYARIRIGDDGIAEDLVQETFLAAIAGRQRFRNEATVSTWLFAIMKRKIVDHFRRNRSPVEAASGRESTPEASPGFRSWNDDPAEICEDREFWNTFDRCIDKLPNKLAEVYILREINQHSPKEIRELLGISATNLSMRLHRCRLAIRECLNQNWFREDD